MSRFWGSNSSSAFGPGHDFWTPWAFASVLQTPGFPAISSSPTVPTVESVNAPVEPCVIDTVTGWNGKRYWMGYNNYAYPANNDQVENPSVVVSVAGDTFNTPTGGTNPVVPVPAGGSNGIYHNSDARIYIHPNTSVMYLFNHLADLRSPGSGGSGWAEDHIYYTSSDGITWSAGATTGLRIAWVDANTKGRMLDGCFAYDTANSRWVAWTVASDGAGPPEVDFWTTPTIGGTWTKTTCNIATLLNVGEIYWHLDIKQVPGGYAGLFSSSINSDGSGNVYYGTSQDGINWTLDPKRPLIDHASGFATYRASLTRLSNNTGWDVWATRWSDRVLKRFQVTDGETFTAGGSGAETVIATVETRVGSAIANTAVVGKSYGYRDVLKALIQGHIDDGDWTTFDVYNFRALPAQAHALCDFKGTFDDTIVGALTFTPGLGFTGGTAAIFLQSTYNPTNNATNYLQNSAGLYILDRLWTGTGLSGDAPFAINAAASGAAISAKIGLSTTSLAATINGAASSGRTVVTYNCSGPASMAVVRTSSGSQHVYYGGLDVGTGSLTSAGVPNGVKVSHTSARSLMCEIVGGGWSAAAMSRINKRVATAKRQLGI